MHKNIKKSIKYFIIFLGIIISLPTLFYFFLRIPEVQTFAVKRITSHFSNIVKSTISVGKVEYLFFNKLNIRNILIKDKYNDTLLYTEKININIRNINLKNRSYRLGKVVLIKPVVSLVTDSAGELNLKWYLDMLRTQSDSVKKDMSSFAIEQIDINNGRFSLINKTGNESKTIVDFNDLKLSGINGILENIKIHDDSTSFEIYNLGFRESKGFGVKKMNSGVVLANHNILFNYASLSCDSSVLNISHLEIHPDSVSLFKHFIKEVKLDISFGKSLINTSDLKYFVPIELGSNESIWLSGRIFGTVSELRGRHIELSYRENTYMDCDFDLSGLTKIENTFIYIGVNSLKTNVTDFEKIEIPGKGKIIIPSFLYKLGNIYFDGSFTGFTTDFVTFGKISTDQGNINADISFRPEPSKKFRIKGLIAGTNIYLGEISGNKNLLGKLSMNANIDGSATSIRKFAANLTGKIDSIEINKYIYRNVSLNGFFTEKAWDGSVKIANENIKLDFMGMVNFSSDLPVFDFTLNIAEANLHNLNFDPNDSTSSLSMLLTSNFKGNNIDNLDGEIKLLNSKFRKYGNIFQLKDFSIKTFTENYQPVLSLRTDFADADMRGYYNFSELGTLARSTLAKLMPSKFNAPDKQTLSRQNKFTFDINFKNTDKINNFLRTGLLLSEKSYFNGAIFADSIIRFGGKAASLTFRNNTLKDLSIDASVSGSIMEARLNTSSLNLLRRTELKDFSVNLDTKPDNFAFSFNWDNKDKILNKGNFIATGNIARIFPGNRNTILKIYIDSSDIYARNNLWRIKQSEVIIDSNSVYIKDINIGSNDHYYMVDGSISEDPADTLRLRFNGIDISPINYLIRKDGPNDADKIPFNLKGTLSGNILLTNIYKDLLIESRVSVNDFSILKGEYGDVSISSAWDVLEKKIKIFASNNLKGAKMFDAGGSYDPSSRKIDLTIKTNKLPIDALNPLLKVFASGINGFASGKVNLSGELNKLALNGAIKAENASMKIDYLQTRYTLNDTVRFDKNRIRLNNVKLTDEKGNIVILSGFVYHEYFHNFSADLLINANECLVLNTKPKDNELFYGVAYATGVTTIKSGQNSIGFDISAKTGKNTKFYIPLNTGVSATDYSFISFIDTKNPDTVKYIKANPSKIPQEKTGIDLNFDLDITPDAEVLLLIDPIAGDQIKGHGSGKLNISYNSKGDFKISGDYIIEDGDYLFTLKNIINKSFRVENGGKITFNGDVYNADIDLKAIYRTKASLYEILGDQKYSERIPVECQLNLTGKLFNPVVIFNIYLPTANEETRTYLRNVITTEEELSRQFLSLLVMNSFLTTSTSTATAGTSAMAVSTTEMLSTKVSNMLSQISNDFDIGFTYRPGSKGASPQEPISAQEVEVALSTQLLNDKVSINGNFDVRGTGGTTDNTNQITGDFVAEVKLTEKIRFKVFNRYNNPYTGKLVDYTQGVGLFYQQDFNKFSDLFRKKEKPDKKTEKVTTINEK
jgi:hypothetical protein